MSSNIKTTRKTYFSTRLELWMLSLKNHRYISPDGSISKFIDCLSKIPVYVRHGESWGSFRGLFSSCGLGILHDFQLKSTQLKKRDFFDGFSIKNTDEQAVKIKPSFSGKVDVWVIANSGGKPFVYMHRIINFKSHEVNHALMTFSPTYRGGGLAGRILGDVLPFYEKNKVKKIYLVAGLSHGGALWARVGFYPDAVYFDSIKSQIKRNLDRILATDKQFNGRFLAMNGYTLQSAVLEILSDERPNWIWEIRDLGENEKFLRFDNMSLGAALLHSSRWRGHLDLDNPSMVRRLKSYVAKSQKA